MKIHSIRFKTSIFFSGILFLILALYSSVLYLTVKRILYRDIDKNLRIKSGQIAGILNAYADVARYEAHPLSLMRRLLAQEGLAPDQRSIVDELWRTKFESLNLKDDYFQVWSEEGQRLLVSGVLPGDFLTALDGQAPLSFEKILVRSVHENGLAVRTINYPFFYKQEIPLVIRLSTSLEPTTRFLYEVILFMVVTIVLTLALTSSLGILITKSILTPVLSVIRAASAISHKDLSVRIPGKEMDQEMMALIEAFNTMIGRLETAFSHINEFSSHVAHELKTPLAIMKGEIEQALLEDRDEERYQDVLRSALQEIDRMIRIIKDLLLLASLDYKPDIFHFQKADIVDFLKDVYEHGMVLASEKGIRMDLAVPERPVWVEYDAVHLRRLFFNLIHNAIKFTPEGGRVEITLSVKDRDVLIPVADSGPGIASDDLPKIFEKFYRVPQSGPLGHGLGLTIAQSIAKAHHGDIAVTSRVHHGTIFTVLLPLNE